MLWHHGTAYPCCLYLCTLTQTDTHTIALHTRARIHAHTLVQCAGVRMCMQAYVRVCMRVWCTHDALGGDVLMSPVPLSASGGFRGVFDGAEIRLLSASKRDWGVPSFASLEPWPNSKLIACHGGSLDTCAPCGIIENSDHGRDPHAHQIVTLSLCFPPSLPLSYSRRQRK